MIRNLKKIVFLRKQHLSGSADATAKSGNWQSAGVTVTSGRGPAVRSADLWRANDKQETVTQRDKLISQLENGLPIIIVIILLIKKRKRNGLGRWDACQCNRVFGWGWVGWVGSNPVFGDGANPKECLFALRFWGQTQPVLVFG